VLYAGAHYLTLSHPACASSVQLCSSSRLSHRVQGTPVPLPSLSRAITSGSSLPTVRAYTSEGIGRKKRPPGDSPPLQESGQRFPLGKVARFTCVSLDHLREPRPQIHQIGPLSPTVLVLDTQPRIESAVHLADPIEHFQQRDATRDLDEPRENVVDQARVEL